MASARVEASQPAAPKAISIAVYGDDAMMGIEGYSNGIFPIITQQAETLDTQIALQSLLSDSGIVVQNHASGGTASSLVDLMAGDDGTGGPFVQRLPTLDAQIVLENHAINDDLAQSLGPYTDALIAWIQAVRAAGKIPVIEEPNPVCDTNHPNLQNYVTTIDNVAQSYGVALVTQYNEILATPNWQSHFDASCQFPDDYINAQKSSRQAAVLTPLVKTLIGE